MTVARKFLVDRQQVRDGASVERVNVRWIDVLYLSGLRTSLTSCRQKHHPGQD